MNSNFLNIKNINSSLTIDLEKGGKIKELKLFSPNLCKTITVIISVSDNFLSDGSFLMYPWTNRIQKEFSIDNHKLDFPFIDDNNLPIHGLYTDLKRKIKSKSDNSVTLICESYHDFFPYFEEEFVLSETSLTLNTYFFPKQGNYFKGFGYGYHPYLSYSGISIDKLEFRTNMDSILKVGKDLLPEGNSYNYEDILNRINASKFGSNEFVFSLENVILDKCLKIKELSKSNLYAEIFNKNDNIGIKVRNNNITKDNFSLIKLKYLQVYTPKERTSIAIEPQSVTTNSYYIENEDLIKDISKNYMGSIVIELIDY